MRFTSLALVCLLSLGVIGCQTAKDSHRTDKPSPVVPKSYVFGWGVLPSKLATPSGGNTLGAKYTASEPQAVEIPEDATAFEKDRAAILALAGSYKVDFHFMETMGLTPEFEKRGRYNSWGTELVEVLEDTGDFISLQHTLVMFFDEPDMPSEPMVMKHWRQDWTYQDSTVFAFQGDLTWKRKQIKPKDVKGAWTQAVFQVDDSPRYEVVGRWVHYGNLSRWTSELDARPLPRREFSQRSDYKLLEGTHQISLTPTGWVHQQNNLKRTSTMDDSVVPVYLSTEIGINRYTRIDEPVLTEAAAEYFETAGDYWASVRDVWKDLLNSRDEIALLKTVDNRPQFMPHFEAATNESSTTETAREIIESYLID
ncbi:MAG: DUF6607 family protein [Verrucomicrobiota bacterium]